MRMVLFLLLAGALTACSAGAPIEIESPADPSVAVPPTRYQSVTSGTKDYRPRDPKPWIGTPSTGQEDE
jgi:hypothetical protein